MMCAIFRSLSAAEKKDEDGRYPDIVLGARFMDGSGAFPVNAAKRWRWIISFR